MTTPMITGRSCWLMEYTAVYPRPGIEKTTSVMTAPPSRMPTSRPNWVTIGVSAARSEWRKMTRRSDSPLARAVRM